MAVPRRSAAQRGVSLIELMVAVAVAFILALMALPVYQTWVANQQIRTASELMLDGLRIAQGEAVKRNQPVRFVFDNGEGWEVQLVADDSVIRSALRKEGSKQVTLVITPLAATSVVFDGLGRVLDKDQAPLAARITLDLESSTGVADTRPMRVVIDTAAAAGVGIRSCDPKLAVGDPRACPA